MYKKLLNLIVSILIFVASLHILMGNYAPQRGFIYTNNTNTPTPPIGYTEYENEANKQRLIGQHKLGRSINSYAIGPVGICEMSFDTTYMIRTKPSELKYFITLNNLYIKPKSKLNGASYTIEHNKPLIIKNGQKESLSFYIDVNSEPLKSSAITSIIMFPLNKSMFKAIRIIWAIVLFIVIFCIVGIFLGGLWTLTETIAKGKAFSDTNIIILRNISYVSFAFPILAILTNIAIWLYMQAIHPNGFALDPNIYFFNARSMLIGVFFFALYRAFTKGYKLQQENELTV